MHKQNKAKNIEKEALESLKNKILQKRAVKVREKVAEISRVEGEEWERYMNEFKSSLKRANTDKYAFLIFSYVTHDRNAAIEKMALSQSDPVLFWSANWVDHSWQYMCYSSVQGGLGLQEPLM